MYPIGVEDFFRMKKTWVGGAASSIGSTRPSLSLLGWLRSTEEALFLSTQQPWLKCRLRRDFFSLLLSLRIVLRSNPSSGKQWILQMQLAVRSRAK